jgi:hypothetical protein
LYFCITSTAETLSSEQWAVEQKRINKKNYDYFKNILRDDYIDGADKKSTGK